MNREPVVVRTAIMTAVGAILRVLILLGVISLDEETEAAVVTAIDLTVGVAIILLVRPKVTPVDAPVLTAKQVNATTVALPGGGLTEASAYVSLGSRESALVVDGSITGKRVTTPSGDYIDSDGTASFKNLHAEQAANGATATYLSQPDGDRHSAEPQFGHSTVKYDDPASAPQTYSANGVQHLTPEGEKWAANTPGYVEIPDRQSTPDEDRIAEYDRLIASGRSQAEAQEEVWPQQAEVDLTPPPEGYEKKH